MTVHKWWWQVFLAAPLRQRGIAYWDWWIRPTCLDSSLSLKTEVKGDNEGRWSFHQDSTWTRHSGRHCWCNRRKMQTQVIVNPWAPWYNYIWGIIKITRMGTSLRPSSEEKSGDDSWGKTMWDREGSGAGGRKSKGVNVRKSDIARASHVSQRWPKMGLEGWNGSDHRGLYALSRQHFQGTSFSTFKAGMLTTGFLSLPCN